MSVCKHVVHDVSLNVPHACQFDINVSVQDVTQIYS